VGQRFKAYGWHVIEVEDGNDLAAIDNAVKAACAETSRPSLIMVNTVIGCGSPNKAGKSDCHGAPLGVDEVKLTKEALGWPGDLFFAVPERVKQQYAAVAAKGRATRSEWLRGWSAYEKEYPELAALWTTALAGRLPEGWKDTLPTFTAGEKVATRAASGKVLNAVAAAIPTLMGGSADLGPSNNTYLTGLGDFQRDNHTGRNLRFGVREHAMAGILNGMAVHGGLFVYGGTFFVFVDYMRPAIRIAAIAKLPVTYVLTHDSIGVGEDGPTHQPIEQLASLRAIPGLLVIRPSDATETVVAWQVALEQRHAPVALVLTRQNVPVLDREVLAPAEGLLRGGYVLKDAPSGRPDVILIGTGSEVDVALGAADMLAGDGIEARVVALPCWELFEQQDGAYRQSVLPPAVKARVAVEAASSFGWRRYVGDEGITIGIDRFGASAPADVLYREFGVTSDKVADAARRLVK